MKQHVVALALVCALVPAVAASAEPQVAAGADNGAYAVWWDERGKFITVYSVLAYRGASVPEGVAARAIMERWSCHETKRSFSCGYKRWTTDLGVDGYTEDLVAGTSTLRFKQGPYMQKVVWRPRGPRPGAAEVVDLAHGRALVAAGTFRETNAVGRLFGKTYKPSNTFAFSNSFTGAGIFGDSTAKEFLHTRTSLFAPGTLEEIYSRFQAGQYALAGWSVKARPGLPNLYWAAAFRGVIDGQQLTVASIGRRRCRGGSIGTQLLFCAGGRLRRIQDDEFVFDPVLREVRLDVRWTPHSHLTIWTPKDDHPAFTQYVFEWGEESPIVMWNADVHRRARPTGRLFGRSMNSRIKKSYGYFEAGTNGYVQHWPD